jgi:large subunit ribosomal protein L6
MSRIGRKIIALPTGVTVEVQPTQVVIKGPKGQIEQMVVSGVKVSVADGNVSVERLNDEPQSRANHGLMRALIANHVEGVNTGFKKTLKLIGTGYRVAMKGAGLSLSLGFSHPVEVASPVGVKLTIEGNDTINIEGVDRQLVGQVAADIRRIRPPEPYKGKGIRYQDEVVRRKQGKTAAK